MTRLTRLAAVAALGLGSIIATAGISSAMPLAPAAPMASPFVQHVAWGCGPGRRPNPWGRCMPSGGPVYYGYGWASLVID
jgi:hypothetical protein